MFVAMSESERLKRVVAEQTNYVSRAKVRDSSEQTAIIKARNSGNKYPSVVQSAGLQTDDKGLSKNLSTTVTIKGKGTNMEYTSILEAAQNAAICADISPADVKGIVIPSFIYSRVAPPFSQQTLSTAYTAPCKIPGNNVYFPPFLQRGTCSAYSHLPSDSA